MFSKDNLINTPLQRGEQGSAGILNRFSGFSCCLETSRVVKTAEAVRLVLPRSITSLKRGVNEMELAAVAFGRSFT